MTAALYIAVGILALVIGHSIFQVYADRRLFAARPGQTAKNLRAREAAELLAKQAELQVLDVRSAREFAGGALPRALHISIGAADLQERLGSELDPRKPVLVYCAGGYRSRKAVAILRQLGFATVYHLHRGILSWQLKKLPISPTENGRGLPYS